MGLLVLVLVLVLDWDFLLLFLLLVASLSCLRFFLLGDVVSLCLRLRSFSGEVCLAGPVGWGSRSIASRAIVSIGEGNWRRNGGQVVLIDLMPVELDAFFFSPS